MAKMIPPDLSPGVKSSAERRLFQKFKTELPNEWIVLHSLRLESATSIRSRETDFVVISPQGLFCLEAKTGEVIVRNGTWYTDSTLEKAISDPFEQSMTASSTIYNYLQKERSEQIRVYGERRLLRRKVVTGHGVLLPDVNFRGSSIEINPSITCDRSRLKRGLKKYVEDLSKYYLPQRRDIGQELEEAPYSPKEIEAIALSLRRDYQIMTPLDSRLEESSRRLVELTEDQLEIMGHINFGLNPKMLIRGSAGSGKTFCASVTAEAQAHKGLNVLFVCYNKKLSTLLNEGSLKDVNNVTVTTLHSLMTEIVEESDLSDKTGVARQSPDDDYFRYKLPELCLQVLDGPDSAGYKYDVLIVDEGQDLQSEEYLLVLGELLKGGFESGRWLFFYDDDQSIYLSGSSRLEDHFRNYNPARHVLTNNCRNTQSTAELARILSGMKTGDTTAEGEPYQTLWYGDDSEERRNISRTVRGLLSQGIQPNEITILSHRRLSNTSLRDGFLRETPVSIFEWSNENSIPDTSKIRYSTTQSFKGLESKVVLIIGIEYFTREDRLSMPSLLNIASTRATGLTIASLHIDLKNEFQKRKEIYSNFPSGINTIKDSLVDLHVSQSSPNISDRGYTSTNSKVLVYREILRAWRKSLEAYIKKQISKFRW